MYLGVMVKIKIWRDVKSRINIKLYLNNFIILISKKEFDNKI